VAILGVEGPENVVLSHFANELADPHSEQFLAALRIMPRYEEFVRNMHLIASVTEGGRVNVDIDPVVFEVDDRKVVLGFFQSKLLEGSGLE
jgi:hypothetical protein